MDEKNDNLYVCVKVISRSNGYFTVALSIAATMLQYSLRNF